eukprot:1902931-Rhodomonas_salina.1
MPLKATALLKKALPEAHLNAAPELDLQRAGAPPRISLEQAHKCENCGVLICIPGSLDPVEIAAAQRQVLRSITDESHVTRGNFINMRLRLGKAEEKIKQLTEKVHTTEQEKTAVQAAAEALKRQLAEAASAISHLQLQLNL